MQNAILIGTGLMMIGAFLMCLLVHRVAAREMRRTEDIMRMVREFLDEMKKEHTKKN